MTKDERKRLDSVLAGWPGAYVEVGQTKRHERIVVKHGDNSAVIVKSKTSTCRRAFENFLADVRRALRGFEV